MKRKFYLLSVIFVFQLMVFVNQLNAQTPRPINIDWDTNYYVSYAEDLTTRLYTSTKYAANRIANPETGKNLLYRTNNNIILGFGATYSVFTLNIGLNFPFVNGDTEKYGKSSYLDLQTHMYTKKVTLDLYAQYYSGYYIDNSKNVMENWPQTDTFYQRPDMKSYTFGFNAQYIFNYRKFSYRATYVQNEWQKKSAGSWVVGSNIFYIATMGDSAIIPSNIDPPDMFYGANFKRKDILNIGVSGGYYYNLIIAKHVFFSIGLAAGPSVGYSWYNINESQPTKYSGINLNFNGVFRAAIGYNSRRVYVGAFFLNQIIINELPSTNIWSTYSTGNFRIIFAYRFKLKKPIKLFNVRYWNFLYKDEDSKKEKKKKN